MRQRGLTIHRMNACKAKREQTRAARTAQRLPTAKRLSFKQQLPRPESQCSANQVQRLDADRHQPSLNQADAVSMNARAARQLLLRKPLMDSGVLENFS